MRKDDVTSGETKRLHHIDDDGEESETTMKSNVVANFIDRLNKTLENHVFIIDGDNAHEQEHDDDDDDNVKDGSIHAANGLPNQHVENDSKKKIRSAEISK